MRRILHTARHPTTVYAPRIRTAYSPGPCPSVTTFLGLLESGPRHGYDLKRAFDEKFGHDRPLHYGQVYSTMSRLLKNGLVEVDGDRAGRRAGAQALRDHRRRDHRRRALARDAREARAVPAVDALHQGRPRAAHRPRRAADMLDAQRSEHLRLMRVLTERKRKGDLADQLICDHALFHLEADLRWLELTAARLDKLAEAVRIVTPLAPCSREDLRKALRPDHRARRRRVLDPPGRGRRRDGPVRAPASRPCCTASPGSSRPTRGSITYNGRELSAMSDAERSALRRSEFGFVFQFGQLVPELTCVRERRAAAAARRDLAARRPSAAPTAGWSGWRSPTWRASGPARSPAAQGQRVAVARALVTEPAGAVRRRADRRARLAQRRACDGAADRRRPGDASRRSCSSRTRLGWPPTPTARSSYATAVRGTGRVS